MPVKYWISDGIPVKFPTSSGKKYDKFISDNDHLLGKEATKTEHDAAKAAIESRGNARKRAEAMPALSDRLDALLGAIEHLRANGETFPPDVDAILDAVQAAKDANPL